MNLSLSIVMPVYNESGNLAPLIAKISAASAAYDYEIVAVDDGSSDSSHDELVELAKKEKRLKIVRLKRNFGQTAALAAGIDFAKGNVIIAMDADGQNDPSNIPQLLSKMSEGYDVVSGWRRDRKDPFISRRLPSIIANKIISVVTNVPLHDYGCTLKAYRKSVISGIQLYGEMHRFLPAWCAWQGGKIAEVPVIHHPRTIGKSKYGIMRTFKVMIDLITVKFFSGYLTKPNYVFSGSGIVFLLMSFFTTAVALYDKFGPDMYPKFRLPMLLLAVFFGLGAIFLILMGLIAELLVRLYYQVGEQKPYRLAEPAT